MAVTPAGAALTRQHRRTQQAVSAAVLRELLALWPLLDPLRLDETAPGFIAAATRLTAGGRALSSRAAVAYYTAFRLAEGVSGAAPASVAATAPLEAIRTSLLVTGPVSIKAATGRGVPLSRSTADALVRVSGAVSRHALDGGRETVVELTRTDPKAQGWARVTSGDGCSFCQMLASRGPVYSGETVDFESHDHCLCGSEAVFPGYEWPATSVAARERWDALKTENGGPGANLYNFRKELEGR